jgi:signal peptidase I
MLGSVVLLVATGPTTMAGRTQAVAAGAGPHTFSCIVAGPSMEPTIRAGDRIVVDPGRWRSQRGRIVLIMDIPPGTPPCLARDLPCPGPFPCLVKRVVGLPGETVRIDHGVVPIDGEPLAEPYTDATADHRDFPSTLVPPGHVFVLGDNRQNSEDSRFDLGPVPLCQVVGTVVWLARR